MLFKTHTELNNLREVAYIIGVYPDLPCRLTRYIIYDSVCTHNAAVANVSVLPKDRVEAIKETILFELALFEGDNDIEWGTRW